MFTFKKQTAVSWSHFDGTQEVFFGDGIPVINITANTIIFQTPNGTNFPKQEISILNANIIDESGGGEVEYTFTTANAFKQQLIDLNYPYINTGVIGSTPSLSTVLLVGNRQVDLVDTNTNAYSFVSNDKSKYKLITGDSSQDFDLTLDDSLFNIGDVLCGFNGVGTVGSIGGGFNIIIDNSNGWIAPSNTASFTISYLDEFVLRKIADGSWSLAVLQNPENISGGGATSWGSITGTLSSQTDLNNALNAKAPTANPTFTGTVAGITKSMVGLGNVDNTSDTNKPVSTAQQTALDLKADKDLFLIQQSDRTLTSSTSAQNVFDVGIGNSGALTLLANSTYTFEFEISMTGLSTTSGTIGFSFDAGTANITLFKATATAKKANANNASTPQFVFFESTAGLVVTSATTVANANVRMTGLLTCTTAGTFIPRVIMSVASASSVKAGTYLKMTRLGTNTVTHFPV